jgi:uncharacterized protein (DUF1330 family)
MSAYIVVEIDVHDRERYDRYKEMAPPSIAQYGGRYIVRGGVCEALEGAWNPPRFVMLEFDSVERARAWWSSPEYAEAKKLRHATATTRMLLVEGLPPGWTP